jgi:hypothetical protein
VNVAQAEACFFEELIKKKSEVRDNPSVHRALKSANYFLGDPKGRGLDVLVEFNVNDPRSEAEQQIYLGTKLTPEAGASKCLVTHSFYLVDATRYLAKVHLDRDFDPESKEKKPSSHIQTGGRILPGLGGASGRKCCWDEKVDKPRIPSIPICSAILWHWAFLEYPEAEQVSPFLAAWWWKEIVQKAEESILMPFFHDGCNLIREKPKAGLINAFYDLIPK